MNFTKMVLTRKSSSPQHSKVEHFFTKVQISQHYFKEFDKKTELHHVTIYLNSPTFDEIISDAKTNFVTKVSVLGGTLGLFAGIQYPTGLE